MRFVEEIVIICSLDWGTYPTLGFGILDRIDRDLPVERRCRHEVWVCRIPPCLEGPVGNNWVLAVLLSGLWVPADCPIVFAAG